LKIIVLLSELLLLNMSQIAGDNDLELMNC